MDNELTIEIIGKNNEYYTKVFDSILAKNNDGQRIFPYGLSARASVNWAAFLVSLLGPFPFFFYYRKMYKVAFLLNLASIFVVSLSLARKNQLIVYVYDGAFILFSLFFSNAVYLSCVNDKLQKLIVVSKENRQRAAKSFGGVTYFVPIVAFLISAPCYVVLLVLIEYCKMRMW